MSIAGKAIVPFEGDFSALTANAGKTVDGIASKFKGLLGPVAIVGTAFAAVGAYAIDLGAKFQTSTDKLAAGAQISIAQAQKIGTAFLATGGQATQTAQAMVDAFTPVAGQLEFLNGKVLSVNQDLSFMKTATNLAEASGEALASTTSDLADVMTAFQIPLAGAATAADELFNASVSLGVPIDSLTTSLQRARTAAGSAAPSLKDLSAFVLDLAAHGETGRSAISLLGTALTGIEDPTAKVLDAQKKLGVSFLTTKGQLDPLSMDIGEVSKVIDGMGNAQATATLKSLGFGSASSKLVDLMQAGAPAFDKATAAVSKAGTAQTAAATATDDAEGAFDRLKSTVIDAATSFGLRFMPAITTGLNWVLNTGVPAVENFGGKVEQWFEKTAVPAAEHFGQTVTNDLLPPLESLVSWTEDHIIPAVSGMVTWFEQKAEPALGGFVTAIRVDVLPALADFGSWIWTYVIDPALHLTQDIIPPLLGMLTFVADHFSTISSVVLPLAGALAAVWAVDKVKAWVTTAVATIQTVVAQLGALGGFGGTTSSLTSSSLGVAKVWLVGADPGVLAIGAGASGAGADLGGLEGGIASGVAGKGGEAVYGRVAQTSLASSIGSLALQLTLIGGAALAMQQLANAILTRAPANNGQGFQFSFQGQKYNSQQLLSGTGAGNQSLPGKNFWTGLFDNPLTNQIQQNTQLQKAQAAIAAIATSLHESVPHYIAMQEAGSDLAGMVGKTVPQIGTGFITLENHLTAMGLSFSASVSASDALESYVTKYGPLSSTQMLAFYTDVKGGVTSAYDVWLSLQSLNDAIAPAIPYAQALAEAFGAGVKNVKTANKIATGASGGGGYTRAGGGPITEVVVGTGLTTGLPWTFHPNETVVPDAALSRMATRPSGATRGAGVTYAPTYTIQMYGSTQQQLAQMQRLLDKHDQELMSELGVGPQ